MKTFSSNEPSRQALTRFGLVRLGLATLAAVSVVAFVLSVNVGSTRTVAANASESPLVQDFGGTDINLITGPETCRICR
ncbi:MAG: hypothetical protein ABJA18_13265 [bacterium]